MVTVFDTASYFIAASVTMSVDEKEKPWDLKEVFRLRMLINQDGTRLQMQDIVCSSPFVIRASFPSSW